MDKQTILKLINAHLSEIVTDEDKARECSQLMGDYLKAAQSGDVAIGKQLEKKKHG
ncbi:MAG: hypothetical protein WB919_01040 [Candidatus Sulfotelmatobacter sp.]